MSETRDDAGRGGRLGRLVELVRSIGAERDLDLLLGRIMAAVSQELDADRSSLFLYDHETDELWSKVAQGLESRELRFPAGKGLAGHTARTGEALNIPDAYQDSRFNPEVDRQTGYRTRSVLCVPLRRRDGTVIGVVQALNRKDGGPFDADDMEKLETLAALAAVSVENSLLHEENEALFRNTIGAAAQAIDERDPPTSGHSRRVPLYAVNLAKAVHGHSGEEDKSFTRDRLRQLRYAGMMHDVGKIGVREAVLSKATKLHDPELEVVLERLRRLAAEAGTSYEGSEFAAAAELVRRANQPRPLAEEDLSALEAAAGKGWLTGKEHEALSIPRGSLTAEEWKDMRGHTESTFRILSRIKWPARYAAVPEIARDHHEKPTGDGYSRGLTGPQIPFDARILAVADVYDALTANDRPYKPAIPHEKARAIMEGMASSEGLDAGLTEIFFSDECYRLEES